jgi:arylsulfatase A-like enzyme
VNEHIFDFLQEYTAHKERKPLFILVWMTDPHAPYVPPKNVQKLFDIDQYTLIDTSVNLLTKIREQTLVPTASQVEYIKTRYDQEIFANDRSFGRLLERLKTLGLYQNMTIIFSADHGEEFFEHHGVGHGFTLYNEQIRVPLIIKTPEIKPGVYTDVVALMDIYPTLLDMLDLAEPYPLDGISMLSPDTRHDMLYFEEALGGNVVFARLDSAKKLIFNRQYYRPPLTHISLPVFEAYAAEDSDENQNLTIQGFEDFFRVQELVSYMNNKNVLGIQEEETEISPELDQKLRELGYAN